MNRLTSLATVAVLMAGGLLAVPTPAYADKAPVRKAGVLHVYDGGSLFTNGGIDRAKTVMGNVQFDHGMMLTIDTHSTIPAGRTPPTEGEKAKFFEQWAKELATGDKAKGIYVLVCRSPGYVEVIADKATRDRGFSAQDEQKLRDLMLNSFRAAKDKPEAEQFRLRDEALHASVDFVISDLKDTVAAGVNGTTTSTTKQPVKRTGMSIGGWICLGVCILLAIWLTVALIRALTAPAYYGGPGYGGGGGFGTAFFGGMFGVMAGMWLYDSMWGTHYYNSAYAGDGGYSNSDYGNSGSDAAAGDGDFSGDAGAGGSYDDGGAGDYGGGGDYGGSGGGDDYGGGGDFGGGGGDFGGGDF